MSPPTPQDPDFFAGLGSPAAHGLDEAELRGRVAAFYRSHEGLRSSSKTEAEYEALIFPNDRPEWRHRAADEMFSCALRFLAGCRRLGVPHPILAEPYEKRWQKGGAVVDCRRVAETYGAFVEGSALASYEPQAGDALCSEGPAGPHVSCITAATSEVGARLTLEAADGGQGRKGDMAIERNVYLLDRRSSGPALRSIEAPTYALERPGPPRRLLWGINLWTLILESGLLKA
jgi:hypothetical protein